MLGCSLTTALQPLLSSEADPALYRSPCEQPYLAVTVPSSVPPTGVNMSITAHLLVSAAIGLGYVMYLWRMPSVFCAVDRPLCVVLVLLAWDPYILEHAPCAALMRSVHFQQVKAVLDCHVGVAQFGTSQCRGVI